MKCWGYNVYGQLGLGDTANRGDDPGEMGDSLPAVVNKGDDPGEMGDSLPAVALGTGRTGAPARAAVLRLAPGTYRLRVVAVNSAGASVPSAPSAPFVVPPRVSVGNASIVEGSSGRSRRVSRCLRRMRRRCR